MSTRAVVKIATCDSQRILTGCASIWRSRSTALDTIRTSRISTRGAKTKTTIKIKDLPQGSLAPLPALEDGTAPAKSYPPVLQQHLNNVHKFKDCIVLTRVGDFYEMYFDQVEQYAPLVNLKKAKRATQLGDVPMAGFQHTQLERYLKMFVQDLGKQVAISEQVPLSESERAARGGAMLFDRKVTRIVTAGTLIDETFVDSSENNYLLGIHIDGTLPRSPNDDRQQNVKEKPHQMTNIGLSWVDLSNGAFFTQSADLASLPSLVARISPREIVLDSSLEPEYHAQLKKLLQDGRLTIHSQDVEQIGTSIDAWTSALEQPVREEIRPDFTSVEVAAGNLVLEYVRERLRDFNLKLQQPVRCTDEETMAIDKQSLRNLEIRSTLRDGLFQGSLLYAIRQTATKSGARLLSQRIVSPSMSLSIINSRLDLVQELKDHDALREDVIALLRRTFDTSRLLQKFSIGKGDADDLLGLARTVELMQEAVNVLHDHIVESSELTWDAASGKSAERDHTFLWDVLNRFDLDGPAKVAKNIQTAIDEEGLNQKHLAENAADEEVEQMAEKVVTADTAGEKPPKLSRRRTSAVEKPADSKPDDIWIMRRSASTTLARAHIDLDKLLQSKQDLASRLRTELNISSLTLRWSAQLGHFCHVKGKDTKSPASSLTGARTISSTKSTRSFYLSEWTHLGVLIDDSKHRIRSEEDRVFRHLRATVLDNMMTLRRNAALLDELDVAASSARLALDCNLVRPILNSSTTHTIVAGRHPTVDVGLTTQGRTFTANDCRVGTANEKIYLITGPNMAGKSTYLRQNALITILAQTGLFVPAAYAELGLVDKIFSRVGSADSLYQDQSTFMVEMLETAEILKHATERSFVIMDEVGRGTTPEDGVAVGFACLHHLRNVNQSRVLFATHFHKLADMTAGWKEVAYWCTDVEERGKAGGNGWVYDHRVRRGVNRESHALKVARLAGLPEEAVKVAEKVVEELRKEAERKKDAGQDHGIAS
ncbi:DNA mismatch repair protein mutS [Zymoseptoria brevis]|uniref:DNA mismatch repair protein mutS n=1 Tax=Zymoseptoria brevis TaxID=1047168 RepID=A0A0F4GLT9_9PEZI|nr:DNA mismatch repair protein mutS [Zymoseptoria brevis]